MHDIIMLSILHFERHHVDVPDIEPAGCWLMIHGMVECPLIFTMDNLKFLPSGSRIHFIECLANGGIDESGRV
jgi:sulfane dehydrogenase subunit SoxC